MINKKTLLVFVSAFAFFGFLASSHFALAGTCTCTNSVQSESSDWNACFNFCNQKGGIVQSFIDSNGNSVDPGRVIEDESLGLCSSDDDCGGGTCNVVSGQCSSANTETLPVGEDQCGECDSYETCVDGECVAQDFTSGGTGTNSGGTSQNSKSGGSSGSGTAVMPNWFGVSSVSGLIMKIVNFAIDIAIPIAVVMIIWAGFMFVTAQGSEEKINRAKKNLVWTITGLAIIVSSQLLVGYINEIMTGQSSQANAFLQSLVEIINELIIIVFGLATLSFCWGVFTYIRAAGEQAAITKGKQVMVWGLIGMTVMAGAWGIVELVQSFFEI